MFLSEKRTVGWRFKRTRGVFLALQAGLSFIGENGFSVDVVHLQLNMYTAPALLAACFGVINILLVVIVLR